MSHIHDLIAEVKMEAANTRKILERVPVDKHDWKPHAKSMSLGRLATHVAEVPSWITATMAKDELDFATFADLMGHVAATNEEMLGILDKNIEEAIATLEKSKDEDYEQPWTLRNGDVKYFTLPKKVVLRTYALSHNYHHRAQLGVYLRLLNIPVPGMYGPTADEMEATAAAAAEAMAN